MGVTVYCIHCSLTARYIVCDGCTKAIDCFRTPSAHNVSQMRTIWISVNLHNPFATACFIKKKYEIYYVVNF